MTVQTAILFMCPCTCARHCTVIFCSKRTIATIDEHFINAFLRQVGRRRQRLRCIKPSQATISTAWPVVGHHHIVHVGKRPPSEARKKDEQHLSVLDWMERETLLALGDPRRGGQVARLTLFLPASWHQNSPQPHPAPGPSRGRPPGLPPPPLRLGGGLWGA